MMSEHIIDFYKKNIGNYHLHYYPSKYLLSNISKESYCCIVNSGFSAVQLCLYGTPMFYLNDDYSCVPMDLFAIQGFTNLHNFTLKQLPCQNIALDYIVSQMFHIKNIPEIICGEIIKRGLSL